MDQKPLRSIRARAVGWSVVIVLTVLIAAVAVVLSVRPASAQPLMEAKVDALAPLLDRASKAAKSPLRFRRTWCGVGATGDYSCVYSGGKGVLVDAFRTNEDEGAVREIVATVDKEISGSVKLGGATAHATLTALARIVWPGDRDAWRLAPLEIFEEAVGDGVRGHRRIGGVGLSLRIEDGRHYRIYARRETR